jgi:hypothetical protein
VSSDHAVLFEVIKKMFLDFAAWALLHSEILTEIVVMATSGM